jgi:hypothetical protein
MKLCKFRTVRLSIIRSCRAGPSWSCSTAVYKPVWHIPLLSVQWINSWWWTDELSEACRVSWQNKFVKLVHLVGFITKKKGHESYGSINGTVYLNSWDNLLASSKKTRLTADSSVNLIFIPFFSNSLTCCLCIQIGNNLEIFTSFVWKLRI